MQTIVEKLTVCKPCSDDAIVSVALGELRALEAERVRLSDLLAKTNLLLQAALDGMATVCEKRVKELAEQAHTDHL